MGCQGGVDRRHYKRESRRRNVGRRCRLQEASKTARLTDCQVASALTHRGLNESRERFRWARYGVPPMKPNQQPLIASGSAYIFLCLSHLHD